MDGLFIERPPRGSMKRREGGWGEGGMGKGGHGARKVGGGREGRVEDLVGNVSGQKVFC